MDGCGIDMFLLKGDRTLAGVEVGLLKGARDGIHGGCI